jgi:hypothetical protein
MEPVMHHFKETLVKKKEIKENELCPSSFSSLLGTSSNLPFFFFFGLISFGSL